MATSLSSTNYSQMYLDEYCGNDLLNVCIAFIILNPVFVVMRFTARRIGGVSFAIDDILVALGLLVNWIVCGVAIAMVLNGGVGRHIVLVEQNPATLVLWTKYRFTESIVYLVAVALPKLAILVMYYRVFASTFVYWFCWVVGSVIVGNMIACCVAEGLACQPFEYFWNTSIAGACVNIQALYTWASFPNLVTDVAMLILPIPYIWRLQMATHVKWGVTFTFLTASIGLIASCFRFANFAQINPLTDGTWASVSLMIWSIVEPSAYLIAACLCTLRPLFTKVKERSWHSSRKSSTFSLNSRKPHTERSAGISKTTTVAVDRFTRKSEEDELELIDPPYHGNHVQAL